MFSLQILFYTRINFTSKNIFRHLASKPNPYKDPGIGARKKLVSLINNDQETEWVDFEDLESDFMNIHKSHKDHLKEKELLKKKEKYHIIQQKYFRKKFLNFLMWHDKEQIRYLHKSDPEQWTIERLSEGFPALPETIHKIVKSNWTKANKQHKITSHDLSVQKNWKLFNEGKISDLPEDLVQHLKKFTSRAYNFKPFILPDFQKSSTFEIKSHSSTEFSKIITSYEKMVKKSSETKQKSIIIENKSKETYLMSTKPHEKQEVVTLNQLKINLQTKSDSGATIKEQDYIIMNFESQESSVKKKEIELVNLIKNKYPTPSGVQISKQNEQDLSHLNYPEKINIPEDLRKKQFIYKLNDCYYDDDGEFLYRVPGMG